MPHFFVRKETGRKETPRAELRSLINCTVQPKRVNSLRSDNTRLVVVCLTRSRWTAIPCFAFVISSLSKTLQPPLTRAHLHWLFAALSSEFFTLPFPDGEGWGLSSHLLSIFVFKNLKDYRPNVVSNHCLRNNYKAESVWTKWVIPLFVEQIQMINERSVSLRVSFWPLSLTDQRKRSKKNILQTKLHQIRFNYFLINSGITGFCDKFYDSKTCGKSTLGAPIVLTSSKTAAFIWHFCAVALKKSL